MSTETKARAWSRVELSKSQAEAIDAVTAALKSEGFGILTRIDLHEAFREKLDVDFRPYTILGACNPKLAHAALQEVPEIGLFLPCNVTVEEVDEDQSMVRFVDPQTVLASASASPILASIAADAGARLERVAGALER